MRSNYLANFYLLISQITFLVCGYGIQIIISRMLMPADFGLWGILTATLIWFELIIISGFPKAVTKYISESNPETQDEVYQKSFFIQLLTGVLLGLIFYILAIPLADFFDSDELIVLFQISACDIPFYGLYFENVAVLNGLQKYRKMLWLQVIYSVSKVLFVSLFMFMGFGLIGAAWGNVLASVLAYVISQFFIGFPFKVKSKLFSIRKLIRFGVPSTMFVIIFAFMQRIDFIFLKSMTKVTHGLGYYWAAVVLAKTPYFLVENISKKIFSVACRLHGNGEANKIQNEVQNESYFIFFLLFLITSITLGAADNLLGLLFPSDYTSAGTLLRILIIAYGLNSLMFFGIQILLAIDKLKVVIHLVVYSTIFGVIISYFLITEFQNIGAAIAALCTFGFGSLITMTVLIKITKFKIFDLKKYRKLIIAGSLTVLVGINWEVDSILLNFLKLAFLTIFYVSILFFIKEPIIQKVLQLLKKQSSSKP